MSEIEMIEIDAIEYRRVMDENKRLKDDVADLEYKHSRAMAERDQYKLRIFTYGEHKSFRQRIFNWRA